MGIRPPAYDKAREAAIEKQKSVYIPLECGHMTTWELDESYSCWRPAKVKGKSKFFCEACGKWHLRLSKRKPAVVPSEPLF
jgi:hypothetical protein